MWPALTSTATIIFRTVPCYHPAAPLVAISISAPFFEPPISDPALCTGLKEGWLLSAQGPKSMYSSTVTDPFIVATDPRLSGSVQCNACNYMFTTTYSALWSDHVLVSQLKLRKIINLKFDQVAFGLPLMWLLYDVPVLYLNRPRALVYFDSALAFMVTL